MKKIKVYKSVYDSLKNCNVKKDISILLSAGMVFIAASITSCNSTNESSDKDSLINNSNETSITSIEETEYTTLDTIVSENINLSVPEKEETTTFFEEYIETTTPYLETPILKPEISVPETSISFCETIEPDTSTTLLQTTNLEITIPETTALETTAQSIVNETTTQPLTLLESYNEFYFNEKNSKIVLTPENINKSWYFTAYVDQIASNRFKYDEFMLYTVDYGNEQYSSINLYFEKVLLYSILYSEYLDNITLQNMFDENGIFTVESKKVTLEDVIKSLYMIEKYDKDIKKDIELSRENYNIEGFLNNFNEKIDLLIEQIKNNPEEIAHSFYEKYNSKVYTR